MPLVPWDSAADWGRFYGSRYGGYGRAWATEQNPTHPDFGTLRAYEERLTALLALGITTTDRVIVAGCGFGFLMEVAHNRGYPWWGGIDNSADVNARRGAEAVGGTLWIEEDMRGAGWSGLSRNLQRDLGVPGSQRTSTWDWIVTESLLESYSDAELTDTLANGGLFEVCEWALEDADLSQIVHIVYEPPFSYGPTDPVFNEKTLAEWKAMRPAHSFMNAETLEVL